MLTVEIVSPEKLVFSGQADMAVIPGVEGELGVMENHAPTITSLKEGEIAIHQNGAVVKRFVIESGFAQIAGSKCTILTDGVQEAA